MPLPPPFTIFQTNMDLAYLARWSLRIQVENEHGYRIKYIARTINSFIQQFISFPPSLPAKKKKKRNLAQLLPKLLPSFLRAFNATTIDLCTNFIVDEGNNKLPWPSMTQKCTAWTHSEAEEGDEEREAKIGGREKRKEGRKEGGSWKKFAAKSVRAGTL